MDLKTYLEFHELSASKFAEANDISKSSICYYLRKERIPNMVIARQIEKATKGAVTIEDMIKYFESKS
jgi:transcriptional regulator with XRE-family HTH domain